MHAVAQDVAAAPSAGGPVSRRLRQKTRVAGREPTVPSDAPRAPARVVCHRLLEQEELAVEQEDQRKSVYLVTFPHPQRAFGDADAGRLRAPGELTHADMEAVMLDAFANPEYVDGARGHRAPPTLTLQRMAVFTEKHEADDSGEQHIHYHVAVLASHTFRFAPYKRALRARHALASHWSLTHDGYWSAVRYGVIPTPRKPQSSLDTEPRTWARDGRHPSLYDASQEPTTAPALKRRREKAVLKASEKGDVEPKAHEMDLYLVIVENNIRNTPDQPWAAEKLIQILKARGSPALVRLAWKLRQKLPFDY